MKNKRFPKPKESTFFWSSHGIRQVHKRSRPRILSGESPAPASSAQDQRRYPRLDLALPILYKVLGEGVSRIPAEVRPFLTAKSTNVSPIGLCLNLGEPLPVGTILALSIHILDKRERFAAVGQVAWARASSGGLFLTGVEFVVVEGNCVIREAHTRAEGLVRRVVTANGEETTPSR